MKKVLKGILLILLSVLVIIQFFHPQKNISTLHLYLSIILANYIRFQMMFTRFYKQVVMIATVIILTIPGIQKYNPLPGG